MMQKVKAALFNMLLAQCGGSGSLPAGTRWLDVYAGTVRLGPRLVHAMSNRSAPNYGQYRHTVAPFRCHEYLFQGCTQNLKRILIGGLLRHARGRNNLNGCGVQGSIGLEGLSRGCSEAHFIEMDPWVVKKCLDPNIISTGFAEQAIVHTSKAEDFLSRAQKAKNFVGGEFDFISITPPYMLVSYSEIFDLLEGSPVIGESSIVMIEYSKQNRQDIRETIGPLSLVKDRKYGRTLMAIYANINQA